jgi:hypothetical protein
VPHFVGDTLQAAFTKLSVVILVGSRGRDSTLLCGGSPGSGREHRRQDEYGNFHNVLPSISICTS